MHHSCRTPLLLDDQVYRHRVGAVTGRTQQRICRTSCSSQQEQAAQSHPFQDAPVAISLTHRSSFNPFAYPTICQICTHVVCGALYKLLTLVLGPIATKTCIFSHTLNVSTVN